MDSKTIGQRLFNISERILASTGLTADAAIRRARASLLQNSADINARHLLAAVSLRNQSSEDCLAILKNQSDSIPADPVSNRLAGYACYLKKQTSEAKRFFDASVRANPCQADCWSMLGHIFETEEESVLAIQCYSRATIFDRGSHESTLALVRIHTSQKDPKAAIHALRVALLHDRRSPKLNFALARILRRQIRVLSRSQARSMRRLSDEALRCYQTALSATPTSSGFLALGDFQVQLERFVDAKASFARAVGISPHNHVAITKLANASLECGAIEESHEQFLRAIEIKPDYALAHFRFARAKHFKVSEATESYLSQLKMLDLRQDLPLSDRIFLSFALGKIHDDIGRYDEAWKYYDRGNRMKMQRRLTRMEKRKTTDSETTHSAQDTMDKAIDRAIRFFKHDFFSDASNQHHSNVTPIFIVGMPRSGTTLTEQILSCHPEVAGGGELKWIERMRRELIAERRRKSRKDGLANSGSLYPWLLASIDADRLDVLAKTYLGHLDELRDDESYVTDKMPTNFLHLGLIAKLFPSAIIVHCQRNPMDVLVSCYSQNLSAPFCDLELLTEYHAQYRRLMKHWESVLPMRIHTVDYESLVTNPEPNIRLLLGHIGLPWDARCLEFKKNGRSVHTPSKWQVRQPLYSSSIEKWRRFEPQLAPFAERINAVK